MTASSPQGHDLCRCCSQMNGYDCGLWVRMFALLVLSSFPKRMSPSILLALRGAHVCTLSGTFVDHAHAAVYAQEVCYAPISALRSEPASRNWQTAPRQGGRGRARGFSRKAWGSVAWMCAWTSFGP